MHDFCGRVTDEDHVLVTWRGGTNQLEHVILPEKKKSHYMQAYAVFKFSAKVD